jgi:hypothetical protein
MNFDAFFQNIQTDYPNLSRFYLCQIHVLMGTMEASAIFRDYQRKLGTLQPIIRSYATVGTLGYDGVHFAPQGHLQTGLELYRQVARDFYGNPDTLQIASPDVGKVYYSSPARNQITVQFDEQHRMRWGADTVVTDPYGTAFTLQQRQWFYLNSTAGYVAAGLAEGYRVVLTLDGPHTEPQLGYLPPNYPAQTSGTPPAPGTAQAFPGPFLKNERGLRALSFWNVPIADPLPALGTLVANAAGPIVLLTWPDHPTEQQYVLERKQPGEANFTRLTVLPANTTAYTDTAIGQGGSYTYRLRAVTPTAEATTNATVAVDCLLAGTLATAQSGSWLLLTTWQCTNVPASTTAVHIANQHTILLDTAATTTGVRLEGTLRFGPGGTLQIR